MKKNVYGLTFVLLLLFSAVAGLLIVNLVAANPSVYAPYITIQNDGTIDPQTDQISRSGNTYTLTANLTKTAVKILCSNITFDGAGHSIIGVGEEGLHSKWWPSNAGLQLENADDVVVKNVKVSSFAQDITFEGCTNCSVLRVVADSFVLQDSNCNTITESDFGYGNNLLILLRSSYNNVFYNNNITINYSNSVDVVGANFWDNGSVGNYWTLSSRADYDGDGICDAPYVVASPDNVDHYPLVEPVTMQETQSLGQQQQLELSPALLAEVSAAFLAAVGAAAGLLYYLKKRRRS